jgi:iron complex transport system substrate-binding protein
MRIATLSPSATEIAFALGLGDELVGRSAESDFPAEAAGVPVVARAGMIDTDAFAAVVPELILADAATAIPLVAAQTAVVRLEPMTIEGIFNSISTVGAMAAAEDEAVGLLELLRERLALIENRVLERRLAGFAPRRVVCLEWLTPPIAAGRWVPEQVRRAGGWELLGREGEPGVNTTWPAIRELDPDQLLLAARRYDAAAAATEWDATELPPWLPTLRAVAEGEVYALDAAAYFSRPGPRVIDGIGLLAQLFDPEAFADELPADAWRPLGLVMQA